MNAPMHRGRSGLGASVQALGRLKAGAMNRTEEAYARHLEAMRATGELAWFLFEGVKLRLSDACFYTPDFAVMRADGALEMHEVKGFWADDARVKIKVAAERFPFRFVAIRALSKKAGGGWEVEDFS
ncbi:DUF1064 domain-containing protein [Methylobacterium sp. A54F]